MLLIERARTPPEFKLGQVLVFSQNLHHLYLQVDQSNPHLPAIQALHPNQLSDQREVFDAGLIHPNYADHLSTPSNVEVDVI